MKRLTILLTFALSTTLATTSAQADFFGGGGVIISVVTTVNGKWDPMAPIGMKATGQNGHLDIFILFLI